MRNRRFIFYLRLPSLYDIFPHHLTNGTIFGQELFERKYVPLFSLLLLSKTFFIKRRIQEILS